MKPYFPLGRIIDALSREWISFMERNDKRRVQDELAPESESDKRHLTYIWDGNTKTPINTKGR